MDLGRIVVGLLGGCGLKDSREDDQSQIDMFRVREAFEPRVVLDYQWNAYCCR
jgi:hypothetical protein